jgi:hypothetical protein
LAVAPRSRATPEGMRTRPAETSTSRHEPADAGTGATSSTATSPAAQERYPAASTWRPRHGSTSPPVDSAAASATSTSSTRSELAGTHLPAARLTPEISESARSRARQGDGQRRPPTLLHDLDDAHEVFDVAFGALAAGFGAGAGATTRREGRGLGADRTVRFWGAWTRAAPCAEGALT